MNRKNILLWLYIVLTALVRVCYSSEIQNTADYVMNETSQLPFLKLVCIDELRSDLDRLGIEYEFYGDIREIEELYPVLPDIYRSGFSNKTQGSVISVYEKILSSKDTSFGQVQHIYIFSTHGKLITYRRNETWNPTFGKKKLRGEISGRVNCKE